VNYGALFRSALVALLRNKMRSVLTVLGITIGIAAVICVVAIGKAGQARVQQQLNNLGDNFVWIEAGGRAINGVRTGTHDTISAKSSHSPRMEQCLRRRPGPRMGAGSRT
jgi:putative ABC transport system permease protein